MAKIILERSGGFLRPPTDLTLDLDIFPANEAQRLLYLIEDADFFHLPENLGGAPIINEFLYTITIEAGDIQHRVHVNETNMPETLQLLIHELSAITAFG